MSTDPHRIRAAEAMRGFLATDTAIMRAAAAVLGSTHSLIPEALFARPGGPIHTHPLFNRPRGPLVHVHIHLDGEATRAVLDAGGDRPA